MFTGLIEEIGEVDKISKGAQSAQITIKSKKVLGDIKLGDSISTNGVCLTVVKFDKNSFIVDVMPETMRRSNLKNIKSGSRVNLERAMQLGDRLGGHIVSGHVDGIGIIKSIDKEDNATWVSIETSLDIMKYMINKGSVTVDGISLTIAKVEDGVFKVSIIPTTKGETTLLDKHVGDELNVECDVVGKYIERFMIFNQEEASKSSI
ncbi:MAG: riboflavin synthase, partial [Clostridiales bacterium]|nr:riboflavin synthase [Clostridiales bacterium]